MLAWQMVVLAGEILPGTPTEGVTVSTVGEEVAVGHDNTNIIMCAELHDFAQKGGFVIQEEIFKANIEKLGFEIDNLRKQLAPDKLDTLNKISSIASALFGGLALLPK